MIKVKYRPHSVIQIANTAVSKSPVSVFLGKYFIIYSETDPFSEACNPDQDYGGGRGSLCQLNGLFAQLLWIWIVFVWTEIELVRFGRRVIPPGGSRSRPESLVSSLCVLRASSNSQIFTTRTRLCSVLCSSHPVLSEPLWSGDELALAEKEQQHQWRVVLAADSSWRRVWRGAFKLGVVSLPAFWRGKCANLFTKQPSNKCKNIFLMKALLLRQPNPEKTSLSISASPIILKVK